MDTDCGRFMGAAAMEPLLANATIAAMGDTALTRLFTVQMRLVFFDPRSSYGPASYGAEVVNTPANQALAKEAADQVRACLCCSLSSRLVRESRSLAAALSTGPLSRARLPRCGASLFVPPPPPRQSLVLLKNDASTLPWKTSIFSATKKLGVVGRNAKATTNMQGNYFGNAPFLISPCAGINASVHGAAWCDDSADGGAAAVQAIDAGELAAVVLVVGLTSEGGPKPQDEAEGHDRTSLLLPLEQDAYIAAVASAAAKKSIPCLRHDGRR
jgi:hypothetical protein